MRISFLLIGLISLLCFSSCSNQETSNNLNEVYPINLHESINPPETADEWIEEMEFVPLETNKNCYLASRMWYDVSETHIAVSSNNAIHIYDRSGKHINSFKKEGKGPGEYIRIYDIHFMPNTDEVMVLDNASRRIMVYDFHGNATSVVRLKFLILDVVPIDSDIFACYMGKITRAYVKESNPDFVEDSSLFDMIYVNRQGEQVSKYKPFKYPFLGGVPAVDFTGPEKAGMFYINLAFTSNIYQVGPGDHFELKYRFDYLDQGIDTTLLDDKKFMQSIEASNNLKGYTDLDHLSVNENSIMFWAPNIDKEQYGFRLINRKSGNQRSIFMDSTQSLDKYHGIPIDLGKNSSGKWFIQKTEAIDILESLENMTDEQKAILSKSKGFDKLKGLKEDDNQVLVFYKVKDF